MCIRCSKAISRCVRWARSVRYAAKTLTGSAFMLARSFVSGGCHAQVAAKCSTKVRYIVKACRKAHIRHTRAGVFE